MRALVAQISAGQLGFANENQAARRNSKRPINIDRLAESPEEKGNVDFLRPDGIHRFRAQSFKPVGKCGRLRFALHERIWCMHLRRLPASEFGAMAAGKTGA
jgi:hypothetical protein